MKILNDLFEHPMNLQLLTGGVVIAVVALFAVLVFTG